jgi:predicted NBD/HSP70 family sugar kinase
MPALAGGLGALAGADAVRDLARAHGLDEPTATECVRAAARTGESGGPFLDELATRLAYGVASVTIVLDPELVLISGEMGRAGGEQLARRIQDAVGRICPTRPRVALTQVEGNAVLRGALLAALDRARDEVFSSGR